MIYSYDDDEVVSSVDVVKHQEKCVFGSAGAWLASLTFNSCTCTPIHGKRITIEKWDDYPVEVTNDKS